MATVLLTDIKIDPTVQIRRGPHAGIVEKYMEAFEKLPPIDVFDTPEGMLLADGFHRWAAAERLGHPAIEANVREGSREDAMEWAVVANTKHGEQFTREERDDGIRRLHYMHEDWSERQLADAMSVSATTVNTLLRVDEVKGRTFPKSAYVNAPTDSHYREIARAPEQVQQPLVVATQKREWSVAETAQAVRNLKDERVPEDRSRRSSPARPIRC